MMIGALLASTNVGLTPGGWIMMVLCVGLVCGLVAFCFIRIMREPNPSQHHHAPLDIDTHDLDD